jgi:hypothetical protein
MEIKHFKNNEMEGSVRAHPKKLEIVVKFQIATRTKCTEGQTEKRKKYRMGYIWRVV